MHHLPQLTELNLSCALAAARPARRGSERGALLALRPSLVRACASQPGSLRVSSVSLSVRQSASQAVDSAPPERVHLRARASKPIAVRACPVSICSARRRNELKTPGSIALLNALHCLSELQTLDLQYALASRWRSRHAALGTQCVRLDRHAPALPCSIRLREQLERHGRGGRQGAGRRAAPPPSAAEARPRVRVGVTIVAHACACACVPAIPR